MNFRIFTVLVFTTQSIASPVASFLPHSIQQQFVRQQKEKQQHQQQQYLLAQKKEFMCVAQFPYHLPHHIYRSGIHERR
ncbi:unnamed protein product [Ceratitis capitata]|uniref:(Mediterranean fruit fly) hypothetical protein n=1 Tax=Ceratitis capitata TaxID=7213 RepID=A0A811V0E3_CERCA|nr:unnamed protein product [Ceratitis capitata]